MGRAARMATSSLHLTMECRDAPAERLEQIPRRPGPEEDAKRPNRERDCLVGERTRIVNRIKSTPGPAGHSQLQTNPAQGGRASCKRAYPGRHAAATKHLGRAAARHGTARLCCQPDQR